MKAFQSPQQKKRHSLERDRRPCYGESNKCARKSVPLRKRLANRQRRRAETGLRRVCDESSFSLGFIESEVCEGNLAAHKKRWRKCPDATLETFIEEQRSRRTAREGRKARSRMFVEQLKKRPVDAAAPGAHKSLEMRAPGS
jgi:hypothetical protein